MRLLALVLVSVLVVACDAPKTTTNTTGTSGTTAPPPFVIEPSVWGSTTPSVKYEVRELPDGSPGLFDSDGALLLHLLPELVIDVGPAGRPRSKPTTKRFDLVKLTPGEDGGFTLYARLSDDNAKAYDLRIENGPHDPRVHVGVTAKWDRDVSVHRLLVRFRTGPLGDAQALAHDYTWADVADEWVGPVHAPTWVRWTNRFAVHGRTGTENVVVRKVEDRWDVELELYHHENHPVHLGEECDREVDGAGNFGVGEKTELRADFVVGGSHTPLVARFPSGIPAAMAISDSKDGASRVFADPDAATKPIEPEVLTRQGLWLGSSLDELPCANGRFQTLSDGGVTAMWSGETMVSSGANLLAPTETDGRRAFAFEHPGISVPTLFALSDGDPDAGWLDPTAIAQLRDDRGLVVVRSSLDNFLKRDASATKTVRAAAADAANDGAVWLTGVDDVARRLIAIEDVDVDVLPEGVVRVRNVGETDLSGVTLLLPSGASARFPTGVEHQRSGRSTWFDLPAGGDQLLQLFDDEQPTWAMQPADIVVSYEPGAKPSEQP